MNDLLERATRASRQTPTPAPAPDPTRARIMATVRRESIRPARRLRHSWAIPLVAALLATGALAAVGARPLALFGSPPVSPPPPAPGATGATPGQAPRAASPGATADQPTDTPTPAVSASEPSSPAAPDAPGATATTATTATTARTTASASSADARGAATGSPKNGASAPDTSASASDDPAEGLYREAHALHFRGGNPGAAVAAWERYLAAAPRGRFAPEARYNRALALLRAGRRDAGLAALEPFAAAPGGYRQAEARRLLDAAQAR